MADAAGAEQRPLSARIDWLSRRGNVFGCRICHAPASSLNSCRDAFANFKVQKLKLWNVKRHMKSKMHQQNVASMSSGSNPNAPTPELFENVWTSKKWVHHLLPPSMV